MKIGITGSPFTGKSTLACTFGLPVHCTDPISTVRFVYPNTTYSETPSPLGSDGSYVIEGWSLPIELAKWKAAHRWLPVPLDRLIVLTTPYQSLSDGQYKQGQLVTRYLEELGPWIAKITEYQ